MSDIPKYRPDLAEVDREYLKYLPDPTKLGRPHGDREILVTYSLWSQAAYDFEEVVFETVTGFIAKTTHDDSGTGRAEMEEYVTWRQRNFDSYNQRTLAGKIRLLREAGFSDDQIKEAIQSDRDE